MPDDTEKRPENSRGHDETRSLIDGARPDQAASAEHPGQTINQYTLVRLLGEGGFGTVWLAEQHEPVRRQVALKIIKLGMDTRQVIARFEAERQALAVLDHPHIAKVFDAGSTETGRPYFVMEYTEGVTFTDYCDEHQLGVPERLRLFQKVCHAVQHAHQKGIIHRDIKPSNVLVSMVDGEPSPKVIDFGIAKATETELTEHSMFTEQGQAIGTPAYMSPEQTGQTAEDIDTRSDVYSLGVLLYQAITGETPFNAKTLLAVGMEEIRRTIREVDPPKPSTRLSGAGDELTTVAQHRGTDARRLRSILEGDIDWIVMKAIEKDRDRRYQTATGFAEDIDRFLNHEAVLASPPSARYRVGKFVRRNKLAVTAGSLVCAALVAGTVGTTIGLVRATRAEADALRAEGVALKAASDADTAREQEAEQRVLADERAEEARTERDKAEQVALFLTDMLAGVGAQVAQGADTTLLRGILDKTATRVGEELTGHPEIEAKIRSHLGETYMQIRDFESAEENFLRTRDLYRSIRGSDDPDVARSLGNLGLLWKLQGRVAEAVTLQREALAMWRRVDPADASVVPQYMMDLANSLVRLREFQEAEGLLLDALAGLIREKGENSEEAGTAYNSLANLKQHTEDYAAAEENYRRALAAHRAGFGEDHPFVATDLHNLAMLLGLLGRDSEAVELHVQALARCRALYPDGHEEIASNLIQLALLYRYDDDHSHEAPGMVEEAIELQSRLYGEGSDDVAFSYRSLGDVLSGQREDERAAEAYRQSAMLYEARYGERNNYVAISLIKLAITLANLERFDEASAMFDRVLEIQTALFGNAHAEVAMTLVSLGSMHRQAENYEAAVSTILEALEVFEAADLGVSSHAASSYENLGQIYRATDRLVESAQVLRRALEIRREVDGPDSRGTLGAEYVLAGTLIETGVFNEAEALLGHALEDPGGVIGARIRTVIQRRQADLLLAAERYDECIGVLEACYRAYVASDSPEKIREALTELVRASELRQELDPTALNEAATAEWRELLAELG